MAKSAHLNYDVRLNASRSDKTVFSSRHVIGCPGAAFNIVRMKGLEPIRLSTPDPKSGAATNYATSACI